MNTDAINDGAAVNIGIPHFVNPSTVAKDNAADTAKAANGINSKRNDLFDFCFLVWFGLFFVKIYIYC